MSIACLATGLYLISLSDITIGTSILSIVVAAWFVPGAAKQMASHIDEKLYQSFNPMDVPTLDAGLTTNHPAITTTTTTPQTKG